MSECPTADELGRYLRDELAADANRAVEGHAETCPACQRALEALSAEWLTDRMRAARKPRR